MNDIETLLWELRETFFPPLQLVLISSLIISNCRKTLGKGSGGKRESERERERDIAHARVSREGKIPKDNHSGATVGNDVCAANSCFIEGASDCLWPARPSVRRVDS